MTILTSCSEAWSELHDLTILSKKEYCEKWNFDLIDHRHNINCSERGWWWSRAVLWLEELKKIRPNDYLLFMGADTLIMNMNINLLELVYDYDCVIGLDVNGINCDIVSFCHTPDTIKLLERVLELNGREQNEQDALHRALGEKLCDVKILPQRYLNSYIYECYKKNHPNDKGGTYESGDFILHFPGLSYEDKLLLTRQYLPKIIR